MIKQDDLDRAAKEIADILFGIQPSGPPKVEIITTGIRNLVFINGHRINHVLDIQHPVSRDEFGPQLILRIHADEIVHRTVSDDEFKRLQSDGRQP